MPSFTSLERFTMRDKPVYGSPVFASTPFTGDLVSTQFRVCTSKLLEHFDAEPELARRLGSGRPDPDLRLQFLFYKTPHPDRVKITTHGWHRVIHTDGKNLSYYWLTKGLLERIIAKHGTVYVELEYWTE